MVKLVAIAVKPENVKFEDFVNWLLKVHAPMAKNYPGLKKYVVSIATDEKSPFHSMSELWFEDMETAKKTLESPEGQKIYEDAMKNIGKGEVFFTEEHEIL